MENRIVSILINLDGDIIVTYADGTTQNLGPADGLDPESILAQCQAAQAAAAEAAAAAVAAVESIPEDYSQLASDVEDLKADVTGIETALESKADTDDLDALESDITDLSETKANKDGVYDYLTAGLANQLATDQGTTDSVPYLMRPSGGGVAVGSYEQDKIVGGSIVWNQLNVNRAVTSSGGGVTFTKNDNGSWTLTGAGTGVYRKQFANNGETMLLKDHVYFLSFGENFSGSASTIQIYITDFGTSSNEFNKDSIAKMSVNRNQFSVRTYADFVAPEGGLTIVPQVFDLTQMFGTTIADYIHSIETATSGAGVAWLKQHFPKQFDSGYQEYNAGEIKSVSGLVSHTMRDADDNIIAAYPLDSALVLRGIPKITDGKLSYDGDRYLPDGTVERRYGIVDLGTLTWTFISNPTWNCFYASGEGKKYGATNFILPVYEKTPVYNTDTDKAVYGNDFNPNIYIRDSSYANAADFKAAMSGIMLVYELAEPTTETATPYQTPQLVDPDGTEEYVLTDGAFPLPVGHETLYPENLKEKLEGLPWNFSNIIAPTESGYTAGRPYTSGDLFIVDNILYKATAIIASGATITPGTNCTATTVAAEIKALQ